MYKNKKGKEISHEEWQKLFEDKEYKVIVQTDLIEVEAVLSTVWLGLDHMGNFFETALIKKDGDIKVLKRYATEKEAKEWHKRYQSFKDDEIYKLKEEMVKERKEIDAFNEDLKKAGS